ncbi:hypothetical protein BJ742DRAFT_900532 [Cladochytrium replicatum]|nr:hypothetical protein BJ742DRAFT_900532 [Cladochytrium replicatum]
MKDLERSFRPNSSPVRPTSSRSIRNQYEAARKLSARVYSAPTRTVHQIPRSELNSAKGPFRPDAQLQEALNYLRDRNENPKIKEILGSFHRKLDRMQITTGRSSQVLYEQKQSQEDGYIGIVDERISASRHSRVTSRRSSTDVTSSVAGFSLGRRSSITEQDGKRMLNFNDSQRHSEAGRPSTALSRKGFARRGRLGNPSSDFSLRESKDDNDRGFSNMSLDQIGRLQSIQSALSEDEGALTFHNDDRWNYAYDSNDGVTMSFGDMHLKPTALERFRSFAGKVGIWAHFAQYIAVKILDMTWETVWERDHSDSFGEEESQTGRQHDIQSSPEELSLASATSVLQSIFKTKIGFVRGWIDPRIRSILRKQGNERSEDESVMLHQWASGMKCFSKYTHDVQKMLLTKGLYSKWGIGRCVVREGHLAFYYYVILNGEVEVSTLDKSGMEAAMARDGTQQLSIREYRNAFKNVLAHLRSGDSFGDHAMLILRWKASRRNATIITTMPTEFLMVHKDEFEKAMRLTAKVDQLKKAFLMQLPLFSAQGTTATQGGNRRTDISALARCAELRVCRSNNVLVQENERCESLYFLKEKTTLPNQQLNSGVSTRTSVRPVSANMQHILDQIAEVRFQQNEFTQLEKQIEKQRDVANVRVTSIGSGDADAAIARITLIRRLESELSELIDPEREELLCRKVIVGNIESGQHFGDGVNVVDDEGGAEQIKLGGRSDGDADAALIGSTGFPPAGHI